MKKKCVKNNVKKEKKEKKEKVSYENKMFAALYTGTSACAATTESVSMTAVAAMLQQIRFMEIIDR